MFLFTVVLKDGLSLGSIIALERKSVGFVSGPTPCCLCWKEQRYVMWGEAPKSQQRAQLLQEAKGLGEGEMGQNVWGSEEEGNGTVYF